VLMAGDQADMNCGTGTAPLAHRLLREFGTRILHRAQRDGRDCQRSLSSFSFLLSNQFFDRAGEGLISSHRSVSARWSDSTSSHGSVRLTSPFTTRRPQRTSQPFQYQTTLCFRRPCWIPKRRL